MPLRYAGPGPNPKFGPPLPEATTGFTSGDESRGDEPPAASAGWLSGRFRRSARFDAGAKDGCAACDPGVGVGWAPRPVAPHPTATSPSITANRVRLAESTVSPHNDRGGSIVTRRGPRLRHGRDPGELFDRRVDPGLGQLDVLKLAGEVGVVGRHIEVPMPRKTEEDRPGFAGLARGSRFLGHRPQRVCGLRSGKEALGSSKAHRLGKAFVLLVGTSLDHFLVDEQAEGRGVAVVAKAARVDGVGYEAVAGG